MIISHNESGATAMAVRMSCQEKGELLQTSIDSEESHFLTRRFTWGTTSKKVMAFDSSSRLLIVRVLTAGG
jgi:hypothetical protein